MGKPTPSQTAAGAAAAAEAAAAAAATAPTLEQLRQLSPPLPVDEFHGCGGEYELVDGKRVRVGGPALPSVASTTSDTL